MSPGDVEFQVVTCNDTVKETQWRVGDDNGHKCMLGVEKIFILNWKNYPVLTTKTHQKEKSQVRSRSSHV